MQTNLFFCRCLDATVTSLTSFPFFLTPFFSSPPAAAASPPAAGASPPSEAYPNFFARSGWFAHSHACEMSQRGGVPARGACDAMHLALWGYDARLSSLPCAKLRRASAVPAVDHLHGTDKSAKVAYIAAIAQRSAACCASVCGTAARGRTIAVWPGILTSMGKPSILTLAMAPEASSSVSLPCRDQCRAQSGAACGA